MKTLFRSIKWSTTWFLVVKIHYLMIPFDWSSNDGHFTINKGDITNQQHTEWLAERVICAIIPILVI